MSARYQFLDQAKKSFAFLALLDFHLETEHEGAYTSFKDGFELLCASNSVSVRVAYYDMEFDVVFRKGQIEVSYLFLDHNLHANASGLAGCMFPFEKLAPVIDSVAKDIETNYEAVLRGDAAVWQKIQKLVSAPREKKRFLP